MAGKSGDPASRLDELDGLVRDTLAGTDQLPSRDSKAQQEAISFDAGIDLEKDGKEKEHNRHQTFRDHVNVATLIILWLVVTTLLVGIVIFAWHSLVPVSWHFLDQKQLLDLRAMLGTAILSSALTGYVNRRMS